MNYRGYILHIWETIYQLEANTYSYECPVNYCMNIIQVKGFLIKLNFLALFDIQAFGRIMAYHLQACFYIQAVFV